MCVCVCVCVCVGGWEGRCCYSMGIRVLVFWILWNDLVIVIRVVVLLRKFLV